VPLGPRCTAPVGITTTSFRVSINSRTLTNWPGQSARPVLGNSALSFTVPVVWSTWLSTTRKVPRSITASLSGRCASMVSGVLAKASLTWPRSCCGRLNSTEIGLSWVITTIAELASEACTILPSSTMRMPVRPAIGAMMVV